MTGNVAGDTAWFLRATVVRSGLNTQQLSGLGMGNAQTPTVSNAAGSSTETTQLGIFVTGQNNTTATANTIACNYFRVSYIKAPGT